jgi:hypothetical protein
MRGDHDQAAASWQNQLEACRQLGDPDGIAIAQWGLARLDLEHHNNAESAKMRLSESFQILTHQQRPDGIAVVGLALGQLLTAAGDTGQARPVLDAALAAATSIGSADLTHQISELLEPDNPPAEET